jgi:hypothetical protein
MAINGYSEYKKMKPLMAEIALTLVYAMTVSLPIPKHRRKFALLAGQE